MSFITSAISSQTSGILSNAAAPSSTSLFLFAPTITFFLPAPTSTSTTSTFTTITQTAVFSSNFISSNFISTTTATSQPNSAETSTAAELATTTGLTRTSLIITVSLGGATLLAIIILIIIALIFVRRKNKRESKYTEPPRRRPSPIYISPPELAPIPPAATRPGSNPIDEEAAAARGRGELRRQGSGPMYHRALRQQALQERERARYEEARDAGRPVVRVQRLESEESEEGEKEIGIAVGGPPSDNEAEFGSVTGEEVGGPLRRRDSDIEAGGFPRRTVVVSGGRGGGNGNGRGEPSGSRAGYGGAIGAGNTSGRGRGGLEVQEPASDPASRRASSGIWPRVAAGYGSGSGGEQYSSSGGER